LAMDAVQGHFRPEFINRLDDIVVFHGLSQKNIRSIAAKQVDIVTKRLAEKQIILNISDKALDLLGEAGFDPVYGARPLKRAIVQKLENPIAKEVLSGNITSGDSVLITAKDNEMIFEKNAVPVKKVKPGI